MAHIEFENIYKDRVIDTIHKLLKQNLASIPVVFDTPRGQESFLIFPESITKRWRIHQRESTKQTDNDSRNCQKTFIR